MRVRVLVAFNGMKPGDEGTVSGGRGIALATAYSMMGLLKVIDDGATEDGPHGSAEGDPGSGPTGTATGGPEGGDPGKDPGSRRHRKDAGSNRAPAVQPPLAPAESND
jgi:hypothetical protein